MVSRNLILAVGLALSTPASASVVCLWHSVRSGSVVDDARVSMLSDAAARSRPSGRPTHTVRASRVDVGGGGAAYTLDGCDVVVVVGSELMLQGVYAEDRLNALTSWVDQGGDLLLAGNALSTDAAGRLSAGIAAALSPIHGGAICENDLAYGLTIRPLESRHPLFDGLRANPDFTAGSRERRLCDAQLTADATPLALYGKAGERLVTREVFAAERPHGAGRVLALDYVPLDGDLRYASGTTALFSGGFPTNPAGPALADVAGYRLIMDAVDYLLGTLPGACITADRVLGSHVASASGTTCDSTSNDAYATCGPLGGPAEGVTANLGMDVSWRWVPVAGVTYNVAVTAVSGLNAHVTIQREGDCTTESLACGDDPVSADARIERFEPATADPLLITVDSYGECGAYQLAVTCGHDIDADGVCDEVEALCGGDERAGDSDDDDICDDLDRCVGDDYSGDTDGDGVCDDRDTCWPVDATLPPVAPVSDTGLLSRETGVLDRSVLWTAPAAGPYTFHLAARPGALARSVCVRPRCDGQDLAFACDLAAWSTTEPVDATVTWTLDAGETVRVVVGAGIVGDPAPHELTIVCVDSDGDGVCEGQDPCYGASDLDADQDGWCDEVDVCLGDDASGDADDDGVCDSDDLCLGLTNADEDLDGWCDDLDLCVGDDATGDSDQDGVCDSDDPCVGSANTDEDLDGWCDDLDCIGDPASGDSDGDDICDSLDPCHGDQRIEGDRDGDGICDYSGACGQYDFDIASELGLVAHEYNCYHGDRYHGSCNAGNHGDTVFVWHAPYAGTYDISMSSASAAEAQMMYVLDGSDCTSHPAELFCDSWNDSRVRRTVSAGERLRIVVEKQRGIQGYTYEQCGWFDLSIRCVTDRDGDGYCDDADPCPGDTGNDPDGDGVCAAVDACFGDDASGDSDGDGVCDDQDPCLFVPNGDVDADGRCDALGDACVGEDSAGDSDGDGVCDDRDLCVGDDAVGDPDRDAMCSDVDPCPRARGFVDSDGDGSCDADDLCAGDDRTGDADADGRCGDRDVCPTGPDRGIDGDLGSALGVVVEDDTCGASGDFAASCGRTRWWQDGSGGPDLAYLWTAPHADRFVFEVSGGAWNSTLHLRRPDYCKATPPPQLACDDNSGPDQHGRAELTLAAGEQVFVVVDGVSVDYANSSVCGPFSLSVTCVDDDGDGVCDGIDPCPEDNPDDGDGDGICDSDDLCRGDNQTGDADGDRVCDDLDQCTGNDAFGDGNGDGFCELPDLCFGDDRVGDADADGLCDDTDLCFGDELRGDLDLDGICDDLDTCDGQYDFADFELELGSRRGRFGPFTTCGGSDTLSLGCNPRFEASGEDLVMRWAPPFADDWTFRLVPVSGIVPMLEVRGAEVCPPWSVCDLDPVGSPQLVESLDPDGPYYRSEVWVIAGGYDDLCGTFELDILCTDDDGDDVCNRFDVCAGDDRRGDADGDGFCDDVDLCLGDDATGDSDHDRICDALDACLGDDRSGDADADGYCALDAAGRVLDCGPDDPSAYPGSTSLDVCDGVDQQCDGVATDEAGADLDGDGRCDEIDDDRDGDGCPDVADDDPDVVGDPAAAPSPDLTTEAHVAGSITGGAWTVAVDGDRAIVGAPSAGAAGRISVFEHGPAGWTEVLSLASPGPVGFGRAVDISGDVAVVGAVGATNAPGEVWVLSRGAGGAWGMTTMLSRAGLVDYGRFGQAVSVSGGRIAVGAREAVHLFARAPDRSWSVEDSLDNHLDAWSGDTGISLPANTYYGAAVSLDGDRLAVGAPGSPGDPSTSPTFDIAGAVFVYERGEGGAWRFDYAVPSGPSPALGVSARYLGNRVDLRGDDLITQYGELAESGRRSTVRQYRYDGAAWAFVREISGPRQVGDGLALDDRYAWVRDGETGQILAVDLRSGAVDEAVTPAPTTQGAYGDLAIDAGRLLTVGSDLTDAAMVAWESGRPLYDGDANGLPDDCELCLAQGDADGDRVCDAQDPCPLDAPDDSDGDAVCDSDDQCVGDDLAGDSDGDGVCDDRDVCWGDDALGDGDGDGVCSDLDACFGDDALGDGDGDGVCADLDACAGDDRRGDLDGDGVCDDRDACVGDDAVGDADGDGVCDDIDACVGDDAVGDADGDGVCDDRDACVGDDAAGDADDDGVCDDRDACVGDDATGDVDDDGVCDDLDDACDLEDIDAGSALGPIASGNTCGADPDLTTTCPFGRFSRAVSILWTAPADATYLFTTNGSTSPFDTHLYLRRHDCQTVACDNDSGEGRLSSVERFVSAGETYLIVVSGVDASQCGAYVLNVTCASADTDGDGACDALDACPLDEADDSDGDGSCDSEDLCFGDDLSGDADADGLCSDVDPCPLDPGGDSDVDGDGVCNSVDLCVGDDLSGDLDGDGACDDLDPCPETPGGDSDLDGVCDADDLCGGFDDTIDRDADGLPDACDACPDDALNDVDLDGVCGDLDLCLGEDRSGDGDADGRCDDVDPCFGQSDVDTDRDGTCDEEDLCPLDAADDSDGDGVCDGVDLCPAGDDRLDSDVDGVADACDPCPLDPTDDSDGDGACDSVDPCPLDPADDVDGDGVCGDVDACPAGDDRADADGDGIADACDPCPVSDDVDGDGVCDDVDTCIGGDANLDGDRDGACDAEDTCAGYPDVGDLDLGSASSVVMASTTCGTGDGIPDAGRLEDALLSWTAPAAGAYRVRVTSDAATPYLRAFRCGGAGPLAVGALRAGATELTVALDAGDSLRLVVEVGPACGAFELSVTEACAVDDDHDGVCDPDLCLLDDSFGDANHSGICDLWLSATPMVPGEVARLEVRDAMPRSTVGFFVGTHGRGPGPCAPAGSGTACLGLRQPIGVGFATADADGRAHVDVVVPRSVPGGTPVLLQAIWGASGASEASAIVPATVQVP